jgi:hypothetical protein
VLDLEPIKNELAGAGHPEWFVGLDHMCGDEWLAVFDADPDAFDSALSADVAYVCGGIHPDKRGRAVFIAAAPLRAAALIAEVERLRTERDCAQEAADAYRMERDEALAALRELVVLKEAKDAGFGPVLAAEYEDRKPAAWAEARRVVLGRPSAQKDEAREG